jgi:hypothetical protein
MLLFVTTMDRASEKKRSEPRGLLLPCSGRRSWMRAPAARSTAERAESHRVSISLLRSNHRPRKRHCNLPTISRPRALLPSTPSQLPFPFP